MSNWQLELRHLALFAIAMTMCACASIGHIKVPSEQVRLQARPSKSPRVLIIAIDGLRTDTVARYLRVIRDSDYEPNWNSGLARLALDGFKFARSNRTENDGSLHRYGGTCKPRNRSHCWSTWHRRTQFLKTMADGTRVEYDFRNPLHAGGIWYTALGDAPTRQTAPLATTLLNDEPWWSALGQFVRIGITFFSPLANPLNGTYQVGEPPPFSLQFLTQAALSQYRYSTKQRKSVRDSSCSLVMTWSLLGLGGGGGELLSKKCTLPGECRRSRKQQDRAFQERSMKKWHV